MANCRVCDSTELEPIINLGNQPWGNNFLTKEQCGHEPFYPLRVMHCAHCKAAQLDTTVPKEVMFSNHTYLSGTTKTLNNHFRDTAQNVDDLFFKSQTKKSVLDIGSNDGTQLKYYRELGYGVLGVESSTPTAKVANDAGISTLNKFFNEQTAKDIGIKFDVINASGVFFHLEELHSVCEGIKLSLADDGVFVVQFIYAKTMIENGAFDQIYHEHLLYYTLETIDNLLLKHNLSMFDCYLSPIHGGSIIGFVKHLVPYPHMTERYRKMRNDEDKSGCNDKQTWLNFSKHITFVKTSNLIKLNEWRAKGKSVYGMGAPVKGNTLLNTFGIKRDLIQCLVEKNESRRGLFAPGSHIPILMEAEVEPPDVYYCLAWNFKKEILANNQHLIDKGVEFYFPVDIQ